MAERLGEFGRIARFFRPLAAGFPGALGLVDDAAVLGAAPGRELVVTADAIVEGVHFQGTESAGDIARKALRVNLSDLAAKGAEPLAYLLVLALRSDIADSWVGSFAEGLAADQAQFGIALAGGDSVSTSGPLMVSITALGSVAAGRMVARAGARPGHRLFVTGTIGDAALGLKLLIGEVSADSTDADALIARYRIPEPRVGFAAALGAHATAALDVSDGLVADAGHLCRASGVLGTIEAARVPLSPAARRLVRRDPGLWPAVFGGGDDYEILFAVPADSAAALQAAAGAAGIAVTEIGGITEGSGEALLVDETGRPIPLDKPGWTHP